MAKSRNRKLAEILNPVTEKIRIELLPEELGTIVKTLNYALTGTLDSIELSANSIEEIISYRVVDSNDNIVDVDVSITSAHIIFSSNISMETLTAQIYYI